MLSDISSERGRLMPTCRVCQGQRLEQFLDLGDQPHCNSLLVPAELERAEPIYPLKVWFCYDCTTVQIDYTVPKEQMFSEYLYVSGTTETLKSHFRASAEHLVDNLGLGPGDLVIDIGSNDGTWLKSYTRWKLRMLGVEPASNLSRQANAEGVATLNRFFDADTAREIIAGHGYPKLVTAAGVFFHLEELQSATEGVRLLLDKGGTFCVQAIYLGEILRNTEFDNIYHEHLTYWTVSSIRQLFDRYGLEVYHADLLPIHGGSLELLVSVKGAREVDNSVIRFLAQEKTLGLHEIATYRGFAERVWTIRDTLLTILRDFKDRGKIVYAFGAPAKGATLLNSFGITTNLVPLAVERNLLKIGKIIPGARIPIVDEDAAPVPDAYLVLPWNFLPEFLQKKRQYIIKGGAFIVPIPDPVVINADNYGRYVS
jgi:hypothetical protein